MIQLLAYTPIPMPMPMPICSGSGTSTPLPPISNGFMCASLVCVFISLLVLITTMLVGSVSQKTIPMYAIFIPLFLSVVCIGISLVCALFGL